VHVDRHVLQEVDQLQRRADRVRVADVFFVGRAVQVQHQEADRIGRARAVVEQRCRKVW
jgi:hypothetical protein